MEELIFIDDDADELQSSQKLVAGVYERLSLALHWPGQKPTEETVCR
jgi:hypothetical protein